MKNHVTHDAHKDQFLKRRRPCLRVHAIAGFIDHRLSNADRSSVEQHLLICDDCMDAVCVALEVQQEINAADDDADISPGSRERLYGLMQPEDTDETGIETARMRLNNRTTARWSLRAAAVIAVCILGYQVGVGSRIAGSVVGGNIEQDDAVDPTFGLFDDSTFWIEGELLTAAISNAEVYKQ